MFKWNFHILLHRYNNIGIRHTLCYYGTVKAIHWNREKNRKLIEERGVSFEMVARYIENEEILDIYDHPDKTRYPNQRIFVIAIEKYIYLVPFIETEEEVFLKTLFPSRKATRDYLGEGHEG